MSMVAQPQSRDEIQRQFSALMRKHEAHASQISTKAEEAEQRQHAELVERATGYTVESIVNGLAQLQLSFGSAVDEIAGRLESQADTRGELRRAIEVEQSRLERLQDTIVAAEAIAILDQDGRHKLAAWEEQAERARTELVEQMATVRESWAKQEQERNEQAKVLSAETAKAREQAEEAHGYELARQRKVDADERSAKRLELERDLAAQESTRAKDWGAREKVLADEAENIATLRTRVAGFEDELAAAAKAAREKAIGAVHREAKFELEMLDKEHDGNVKVFELKVQTLEERIQRHAALIVDLDTKLDSTIAKSQNLAEQAFVRPNA
ncbi:MAG: hypothetical protein K0V04_46560 [Deltaproteobacteria bacterium]|nr:hypothetical protein [Deltaproteobacteria bacterium]